MKFEKFTINKNWQQFKNDFLFDPPPKADRLTDLRH